MLNSFFAALSERLYKENDLSDILYALLKSDQNFREKFLEMIDIGVDDNLQIFREYTEETPDCRPDLFFNGSQSTSLLEIKQRDRNYHFDQYKKGFPDSKRRFISIYKLNKNDLMIAEINDFKCYTWSYIIETFKKQNNSELVTSVLKYIQEVCEVEELKQVSDLNCLNNLNSLLKLFRMTIDDTPSIDDMVVSTYGKVTRAYGDSWIGCYMQIEHAGKKLWPCIAICFEDLKEYPEIMIWFEYDWNSILRGKVNEIREPEGTFKIMGDDYFAFQLNKDDYKSFIAATLEEQRIKIKIFIENAIRAVSKYL
ncbi:MAG: hypothetical protein WCJ37_11880 [Syntrophus sp. (in: bacteria)]